MHPDLEAILAADEESRARLAFATSAAERRLEELRAAAAAAKQQRVAAAQEALAAELAAIRRDGDGRMDELKRAHDEQLRSLAEIGDRQFEIAVRTYIDIVCNPEAKR